VNVDAFLGFKQTATHGPHVVSLGEEEMGKDGQREWMV
jgi:hypothetical protein